MMTLTGCERLRGGCPVSDCRLTVIETLDLSQVETRSLPTRRHSTATATTTAWATSLHIMYTQT